MLIKRGESSKMKIKTILFCYIVIFLAILNECTFISKEGVEFNNEQQLKSEGFVAKLNQEIYLGEEKVIFEKVAFDRNSMTFVYHGGNVQLTGSGITIKGSEQPKPLSVLEHISQPTLSFGGTMSGNNYHVVSVPHNLKLEQQQIEIEINMNGRNNRFTLNFPGDKIAASTSELVVDSNGIPVEDVRKASVKVTVGIGSTVIESKGTSDFTIVDKVGGKILRQSCASSTTGESTGAYQQMSLPRKNVAIRVIMDERTILLSNK